MQNVESTVAVPVQEVASEHSLVVPSDLRLFAQAGELSAEPYERALVFLGIRPGARDWALFWQRILMVAGVLFFVAGAICFFAWNWAEMSHYEKFGLIIGLMCASAALPLWKGPDSTAGGLGLLACGLLCGPLLAVYGQHYQTGADAWELFRAWAIFLLPLAVIGRQNGLWLTFWAVGSLALGLYFSQTRFGPWESLSDAAVLHEFLLIQIAAVCAWEGAMFQARKRPGSFLHAAWPVRIPMACLLCNLTFAVAILVILGNRSFWFKSAFESIPGFSLIMYIAVMCAGFFWYRTKRLDPFMLAIGLASLVFLFMLQVFQSQNLHNAGGFFLGALLLVGCAFGAGKLIMHWHNVQLLEKAQRSDNAAHDAQARHEKSISLRPLMFLRDCTRQSLAVHLGIEAGFAVPQRDEESSAPWYVRLMLTVSAWVAAIFLIASIAFFIGVSMGANHPEGLLTVCAALCLAAGAVLSRQAGLFGSRFGEALGLAGALCLPVGLVLLLDMNRWWQLPGMGTAALVFFIFRQNLLRSFSVVAFSSGLLGIFVEMVLHADDARSAASGLLYYYTLWGVSLVFFAGISMLLIHIWSDEKNWVGNKERDAVLRPFLTGLAASLLFAGIAMASWNGMRTFFGGNAISFWWAVQRQCGTGAGLGLCLLAFRIGKQTPGLTTQKVVFYLGALFAIIAGYWLPWLTVGLFLLALGRYLGSMPLAGLAFAYLTACVHWFYYSLNTTLLHKSYTLCAAGIVMAAFGYAISKAVPSEPAGTGGPADPAATDSSIPLSAAGGDHA